jgi:NodT family efflux transporter outer membrane factor (OMF) lipoprotein
MKSFSVIAALGFLALLAGCAVGPDYHQPQVSTPAQWATPLAGGETNGALPDAAWWKKFNDPELDSLMERAVKTNLDLKIATARVREARAQLEVTSAEFWPSANATGSYSTVALSRNQPVFASLPLPPGIPFANNVEEAGFDASWELDVFGGTRRAVEAAKANIAASEFGERDVLVSLQGEVARNYIEARGFQRRLDIARSNIVAQQDVLDLTRNRYQAGLSGDLDVQQAAALLASTQSQVPPLETGFAASAHRLGVLLALPPGALRDELSAQSPIPAAPPEVPAGLPSDLLLRRPDIRRAERDLAAANALIGVATADLYPKFSLTGDFGLESVSTSDWFAAGSRYWNFGPTVQWRIFDAGRIRANIRVQNARQEQALAAYEQTVLGAMEDVENALTAYAKEQTRRESLKTAVDAGQQALNISRDLYDKGLADFLQVLDAQRSLFASQDALAQSDRDVSLNLVAIYKALGGGWQAANQQAMK